MAINWIDAAFVIILLYFTLFNNGGIRTIIELCGFLTALIFSYRLYVPLGILISSFLSVPRGYSFVIGFFLVWFITELLFFFFVYHLLKNSFSKMAKKTTNAVLGYFVGALQGSLVFLFLISLVFGLPVRGEVKQEVLTSHVGPFFVGAAQSFESQVKAVFGEAATETLNFLTIEPRSGEVVSLGFKVPPDQISYDAPSEQIMLEKVNSERQSRGIPLLVTDAGLTAIARAYATQMLVYGFFSHVSPVDQSDVTVRAGRLSLSYTIIGENLAFAPDVYIAHQGLMNSPGHRANILDSDFKKVGIGVADAGPYGKMFVQDFSN